MDVRPDPTVPLGWSDFDRPIHRVFADNADRHGDRICVIETDPRREFTYRNINEASNVLAQHLHLKGIQRDEVVMIYAYRGVDLIVAIMGVLKAGATFSVIDPAYPEDRQIIYLEVAAPKALVVIKKANEVAGGLTAKVTTWIAENLNLKATVPELMLNDDGTLAGGSLKDQDVLDDVQSHRGSLPNVVVGPDSNPTLSFTSGSEGRPKGVLGRHFSLVYYFPWMAETFGLSENDRFTMLSGIAHDPIQRDIFTPLFLGAQLLVPPFSSIQHEKLAEWIKEHRATVTHLTPAMGQILCGGATAQFPDLKNAFFVGDRLRTLDVQRLQQLAENVRIINMFGTTETQRAVTYYRIPSRNEDPGFLKALDKDIIPAGKGMKNVQALVVDPSNQMRICDMGEQGEVYIRAAGLAEGYKDLPDLTCKKFVPTWFVDPNKWMEADLQSGRQERWRQYYKGPRDRLYRSGDLGRYLSDGNVEITGRMDDQIKIRGFRIELGEIEAHLSRHPIVRECVTLVRRDKDEEQTLVSYIVPELSRWPLFLQENGLADEDCDASMTGMLTRFRVLRENVREYLKTKLPSYAVPSVIVPLSRMPLNPNGKVDKPALPFPEPSELNAATPRRSSVAAALTPTEKEVAQIWGRLLAIPAKAIGPDDSFFDLGGHSLLAQRLLLQIRQRWDRRIDVLMQTIYDYPTLRGFAIEVDRALDPQGRRLENDVQGSPVRQHEHYSLDAKTLAGSLPNTFPNGNLEFSKALTIFLTGATGFLGSYILQNILNRNHHRFKIIAHVRAKTPEAAFDRVKQTCIAYNIWSASWLDRLTCIPGDLEQPRLGLSLGDWDIVANEADIIIHNGARVHWVTPYPTLRNSNVLSTVAIINLASVGKRKQVTFISSTSVLDTEYYVKLGEKEVVSGGRGVPEMDNLEGSANGLTTGYGQSKWVSEYLMRSAGHKGLCGSIVRPGYVTGSSLTGASITDDFLVRMLLGCVQLSCRPKIDNTINMAPVDYVAGVAVAAALHPPSTSSVHTAQVSGRPRMRFSDFLGCLEVYGYEVPEVEYDVWRRSIEQYTDTKGGHALEPLLHFVTSDLPEQSKAPELDDTNASHSLEMDAEQGINGHKTGEHIADSAVTEDTVGLYLAYLVELGFMPAPTGNGPKKLPGASIAGNQREALSRLQGRGAVA